MPTSLLNQRLTLGGELEPFSKTAHVLVNTLPPTIKTASSSASSKIELKTHLFIYCNIFYPQFI